jgi:hypothetical protein
MCRRCDQQERVCPNGHVQPKRHGDVFAADFIECDTCGEPTDIREKMLPRPPAGGSGVSPSEDGRK